MKSVGIITFHRPVNYGAVLQAFALCKATERLGYRPELIDYRFSRIEYYRRVLNFAEYRKMKANPKRLLKKTAVDMIFLLKKLRERRRFDEFEKRFLPLSAERYSSYEALLGCREYDAYVAGSDLVWNAEMAEGVNPAYFLDFVRFPGAVRLSYASSIGTASIDEKYKSDYRKMLTNLDSVSVREKTAADLLCGLTDKQIHTVLDPALLLSGREWAEYAQPSKRVSKPYLLVYMVERSAALIECARAIARDRGLEIVHFNIVNFFGGHARSAHGASPEEFLGLFARAACVLTNSFHGCVFSILNAKPFWCVPHSTRGSRMADLMALLGIGHRLIHTAADYSEAQRDIDYAAVMPALEEERRESYRYLEEALAGRAGDEELRREAV